MAFGPVGATAGIILFAAGLALTYFSLTGLFLVVLGAFFGFTSTTTFIDEDQKRSKFSNLLFGFIPTGTWLAIQPDMKLGIRQTKNTWRTYSQTNRTLDISSSDHRITLFDKNGKELMQLKKCRDLETAKTELKTLGSTLNLTDE
jgi:hypothetical protein